MSAMTSPKTPRFLSGCAAAAMALLITGCATHAPGGAPASPPRPQQLCNDQPVQLYIGHNTAPSTLETIRKKSGAYMLRVLGENQPATMDYNPERLNIIANEAGKIKALRCG